MKEYQHFRKVAEQVHRVWALAHPGRASREDVHCGRCGRVLPRGARFTVVRLDPHAGNARSNLAPECGQCTETGATGRWHNPAPPVLELGGLLPWWVTSVAIPSPPAEGVEHLAPW